MTNTEFRKQVADLRAAGWLEWTSGWQSPDGHKYPSTREAWEAMQAAQPQEER